VGPLLEIARLCASPKTQNDVSSGSAPSYPAALSAWSWLGPEYHSLNGVVPGIINPMHIAQKFEHLLDTYRRPDGHRWTVQQLDEATGGVVTRSYVTNLRKGRVESPGYEKLAALAKAMGFPPEVRFDEGLGEGRSITQAEESRGVAGRLEHLFEVVRNPKTGKPY
jgi:transcriptional regulator with XRE-family HTH domain